MAEVENVFGLLRHMMLAEQFLSWRTVGVVGQKMLIFTWRHQTMPVDMREKVMTMEKTLVK